MQKKIRITKYCISKNVIYHLSSNVNRFFTIYFNFSTLLNITFTSSSDVVLLPKKDRDLFEKNRGIQSKCTYALRNGVGLPASLFAFGPSLDSVVCYALCNLPSSDVEFVTMNHVKDFGCLVAILTQRRVANKIKKEQ